MPTPISSRIPGDTQGAEAPPGRARLEALLIQVCRQKPRGLYPISLRPLVLHLHAFPSGCLAAQTKRWAEGSRVPAPLPGTGHLRERRSVPKGTRLSEGVFQRPLA